MLDDDIVREPRPGAPVSDLVRDLHLSSSVAQACEHLVATAEHLLDAAVCAVIGLTSTDVRPAPPWLEGAAGAAGDDASEFHSRPRLLARDPSWTALGVPPAVSMIGVFPIIDGEAVVGRLAVAFEAKPPALGYVLVTGQQLADSAATSLLRLELDWQLTRRLDQVEVFHLLADVVAATSDLHAALRRLNEVLRPRLGIELVSAVITHPRVRSVIGAVRPDEAERTTIVRWRDEAASGADLVPLDRPSLLFVPVVRQKQVFGGLRVRTAGRVALDLDGDLLAALGAGCAEIVAKASLQARLSDTERRLAIADERDKLATELHDSVGDFLSGLGSRIATYMRDAPDRVWQHRMQELLALTGEGARDLHQAVSASLFLDARRDDLAQSLRDLARAFETAAGAAATVRVGGPMPVLDDRVDEALFRFARDGLVNIARHARSSGVVISLSADSDAVTLSLTDDGVPLSQRDPFGTNGRGTGVRSLQRHVEEVKGRVTVDAVEPRGVVLTATVPRRRVGRSSRPGR